MGGYNIILLFTIQPNPDNIWILFSLILKYVTFWKLMCFYFSTLPLIIQLYLVMLVCWMYFVTNIFCFLCQDVAMVIQLMTCACPMALWSGMLRTSPCFCTDGWWIHQRIQITSAEWETTAPPATAPNVSPCSTRDLSLNVTTRYYTQAWAWASHLLLI